MSAFDPVDVREPGQRRAALLQKLTQQQLERRKRGQSLRGASGASRAAAGAPGRAFKNALDFRGVPKVRQTGRRNILPALLAALGAGQGNPHPSELSVAPGMEAQAPPRPTPPPPVERIPLGPNPPPLDEGAESPVAPEVIQSLLQPSPDPLPSWVQELAPLGGGYYYSPTSGRAVWYGRKAEQGW